MIGEMPTTRTKLPIMKVRAGVTMQVVIAAEEPVGVYTHWLGARSYICPGVDCPACYAAIGAKWLGLLPVKHAPPHAEASSLFVLELSSVPYERLAGLQRLEGLSSLYDQPIEVRRRTKRSPLVIEPIEKSPLPDTLKRPVPRWLVLDGLATVYGLPPCRDAMTPEEWEAVAMPRAVELLRGAVPRAVEHRRS